MRRLSYRLRWLSQGSISKVPQSMASLELYPIPYLTLFVRAAPSKRFSHAHPSLYRRKEECLLDRKKKGQVGGDFRPPRNLKKGSEKMSGLGPLELHFDPSSVLDSTEFKVPEKGS